MSNQKTVYVTDGGWNNDIAPKVCEQLRKLPGVKVIDDEEYLVFKHHGTLPKIDACVCTSVNVSGQGEYTEERLREEVIQKNIPLALVGGSCEADFHNKAKLHLEFHSFRGEFLRGFTMTPPAIVQIAKFLEEAR